MGNFLGYEKGEKEICVCIDGFREKRRKKQKEKFLGNELFFKYLVQAIKKQIVFINDMCSCTGIVAELKNVEERKRKKRQAKTAT